MKYFIRKSLFFIFVLTVSVLKLSSLNAQKVATENSLTIILEYGKNENLEKSLDSSDDTDQTIDSNSRGLGATSQYLLDIIYQAKMPILVSAPLWENIVKHKNIFDRAVESANCNQNLLTRYNQNLKFSTANFCKNCAYAKNAYEKLSNLLKKSNFSHEQFEKLVWDDELFEKKNSPISFENKQNEIVSYLACTKIPLNEYTIKIVTQDNAKFYLFIPNKYLSEKTKSNDLMGLKLDTLPELSNPFDISEDQIESQDNKDSKLTEKEHLYNEAFMPMLKNLFETEDKKLKWKIYILGHGSCSKTADQETEEQKRQQKESVLKIETVKKEKELYKQQNQEYKDKIKEHEKKANNDSVYAELNKEYEKTLHYNLNVTLNNIEICDKNIQICKENIEINKKNINNLRYANIIVGLTRDRFVDFLKFLDKEICTETLYYTSCHSGGDNYINTFYDENKKPLKLSYSVITNELTTGATELISKFISLANLWDAKNRTFYKIPEDFINWKNNILTPIKCSQKNITIAHAKTSN